MFKVCLNRIVLSDLKYIYFRHGDINHNVLRKMSRDRLKLLICHNCLVRAQEGDPCWVTNILNQMCDLANQLQNIALIKSEHNLKNISDILCRLANTQTDSLIEECETIIKGKKDPYAVKEGSDEMNFLSSKERNPVLLRTLMSFCNVVSCDLTSLSEKKIEGLCLVYETILNTRNSKVITLPALAKNSRLLKQTHNKGIMNCVSLPSGGKYNTVRKLNNAVLPELCPPTGDFVSTDDNIQVSIALLGLFHV